MSLAIGPLHYGLVEEQAPVEYDAQRGYPLVNVALQPSRVPVRCRVLMRSAGKGEGEYHTFSAGDEVLVALPSGTRGECCIVGKLSNEVDKFPAQVGGQDATQNKLSFVRQRTAHLEEYEGPWAVFSQPSGAFLSVDAAGVVTLRDASKGSLQLSPDALTYLSGDGKHLLQLDLTKSRFTLQAGGAMLVLAEDASAVLAPGSLTLASAGNPAHEHVLTTEALAGILTQLLLAIGAANPGPIVGAALGGAAPAIVAATFAAAAVTPLLPPIAAAL